MWSRIPLVRLIFPFILGILLSEYFTLPLGVVGSIFVFSGIAVTTSGILFGLLFSFRWRWIYGVSIIVFLSATGCYYSEKMHDHKSESLESISPDDKIYFGSVDSRFQARERSCKGMVRLMAFVDSAGTHQINAKVMVYAEPDSTLLQMPAGSVMIFSSSIQPFQKPANPSEFDYKKFLARKSVYHRTFLKKSTWKVLQSSPEFNLMHFAGNVRDMLLEKLLSGGIREREFAVSAALLLGDDSYLVDDIRERYARAGAMHILCVSGLHVGVIFLVLYTMFSFLGKLTVGRLLLPVILITCIWSYSLVTGLAPPVVRASAMITFIIIGNSLGRQRNIYNTLAASALMMLLIDPMIFFGAGFRLSYAAVLGIVVLQRPIYNLVYLRNYLADKIWAITAVSIAAQLGTLPVILFYFHQFPLYSLITNLLVIPMSSMIIYCGILFFLIPAKTFALNIAAGALNALVGFMDKGVSYVDLLPYAAITDISFDMIMMLLLYLILIGFAAFLLKAGKSYLMVGLACMVLFSSYRFYLNYERLQQRQFLVYAINGHSAIDIVRGKDHVFMADSALLANESKINYSIGPDWLNKGLHPPEVICLNDIREDHHIGRSLILPLPGKRAIAWEGQLPVTGQPHDKLALDYLVVRGECPFSLEEVDNWFAPQVIILDSSVPWWADDKFAAADSGNIWHVRRKGAFYLEY